MTAPATLPEWLRPPTPTGPVTALEIPVAALLRTSTDDQQDPTLSLPRQLNNCQRALLPGMRIVAVFYDVESSRKELSQRGSSLAWQQFTIPGLVRDGGLADLLAEAATPQRRFAAVICESIDRIARFTHQGTKIEHDLELAGVPLLASDEPIILDGLDGRPGRRRKRASQVLLRRTKQGVAEWYIIEMLEKSWDGFEVHTTQGWNVGKPPYGYLAEKHKHPVPAKRAEGKHKSKLVIDPVRGQVVVQIYAWRVDERLSYRAIAARLNTDLDRYPPPQPVDPVRAIGRWSGSAVREILFNPKYTGHMCWNRRASKDKLHPGKNKPVEEWVVSAQPTHSALVSIDTFVAAQNVAASRRRSRADATAGALNPHRQTRRVYALRSYIWCAACTRRMFGRYVRGGYTYYTCQPRERVAPEGHPRNLSLPESDILAVINQFFNSHVFGTDRLHLATTSAGISAQQAADEHREKIAATQRALANIETTRRRVFRVLERSDDPDGTLYQQAVERNRELDNEYAAKAAELAQLEQAAPPDPAGHVDLLSELPQMEINLADLPVDRLRQFLDAFAIQIQYDFRRHRATLQATISATAVPHITQLSHGAATPDIRQPTDPHPIPSQPTTSNNPPTDTTNGHEKDHLQFYDMPRRGRQSGISGLESATSSPTPTHLTTTRRQQLSRGGGLCPSSPPSDRDVAGAVCRYRGSHYGRREHA